MPARRNKTQPVVLKHDENYSYIAIPEPSSRTHYYVIRAYRWANDNVKCVMSNVTLEAARAEVRGRPGKRRTV